MDQVTAFLAEVLNALKIGLIYSLFLKPSNWFSVMQGRAKFIAESNIVSRGLADCYAFGHTRKCGSSNSRAVASSLSKSVYPVFESSICWLHRT